MPLFHPFQFQYQSTLIEFKGDYALVRAEKGPLKGDFFLPKALLPQNLTEGDTFTLSFQPQEFQDANKEKELACMRALLNDLLV